jgi:quercetin dioxygenase-like cupin family protein
MFAQKFYEWEKLPEKKVREGCYRKAFSSDNATVTYNRLLPGFAPQPHTHPFEQIAYIIRGHCDFRVGEVVHHMVPGSVVVVPPNVDHGLIMTHDEEVVNLDIFTPKRSEYAE